MAYKVFISFSQHDTRIVNKVVNTLSNPSIEFFVANYSIAPGQSISQSILEAINQCDLFVLIWSKYASDSNWVQQEIGIAKANNKNILPSIVR